MLPSTIFCSAGRYALQVEAVLFDLFDTLVLMGDEETYYPSALKKLHQSIVKNGVDIPYRNFEQAYFEVRDKLYSDSLQSLEEPHFNVRLSETLKKLGYSFEPANPVVKEATAAFSKEFIRFARSDEDAVPVLQKLHPSYKLGLISNLAIPEAGWELLERFGLKGFFDVVVISGEINRRKPSKEIFDRALSILGVEASKAVFIGDIFDVDVKGAKNAGMKAILLQRKTLSSSDYETHDSPDTLTPNIAIKRLNELLSVLEDC